jgi:putative acetyltransferase
VKELTIRPGRLDDLPELQQLYSDTIKAICKKDYTQAQIEVWILGIKDEQRWIDMLKNQFVLVAEDNGKISGFGTLDKGEYIDMFYVHKDYQGQGIANKIYNELEMEVQRAGKTKMYSNVSKTARTFFEKQGFTVVCEQTFIIQGIEITNYRMEKDLMK